MQLDSIQLTDENKSELVELKVEALREPIPDTDIEVLKVDIEIQNGGQNLEGTVKPDELDVPETESPNHTKL